ncbi:MAG: ATP-dependent helicase HrpB [Hyphomicrobiales bacterium]|nr:ATP-dependent helicase HrpB [Hyphomicrobiales bacterium]
MTGLPPLPIDEVLPALRDKLIAGPNLVLVAEPGAGKTTRVPLALLDAPWRQGGKILVLEPRRLAARAAAEQMSRLVGEEVGGLIGYRVRLESRVSNRTIIEIITEGVLTRMLIADQSLPGVAAVLFDEFHERSLDGDLGLALTLDAQQGLREDLRIIIMSATLDDRRIAALLGHAPVIMSDGRAFPVETRHRPRPPHQRLDEAMAGAILHALATEDGSILAFMPGAGDIEATRRRLESGVFPAAVDVFTLYGALDAGAQSQAIAPAQGNRRKIVLATSIAETSLTIDGVRIVIDSGLSRVPRYDPASGLTRLETVRAPLSSVNQRRGRAGRTAPGICIRLWAEAETRALAPFAVPEIRQADLAPLVLDCASCGVGDPTVLRFLDPPPAGALQAARELLGALGAVDEEGRLSEQGRHLTRLPLPPRLAHMVAGAAPDNRQFAAELAVLLQERGLGGDDIDIRQRQRRFAVEGGERAERARQMAQRWAGLAGSGDGARRLGPPLERDDAGPLLALAFPDRLAQRRPERPGEFLLANGRGAFLDAASPLAREPYLAVAELAGGGERSRILQAAPIARAAIESGFAARLGWSEEVSFDDAARAVRTRRLLRLGQLVLSEAPVPSSGEQASAVLMAGIAALGIDCLPWTKATRHLLDRARFLARTDPSNWPALDDETLTARLADWLAPYIPGRTRVGDIAPDELMAALDGLLADRRRLIEREVPSYFEAPTGSHIAIDYHAERGPVVAIRVQELFGLDRHPMLGGGRVAITFDLLSPAHRPIQTTCDLPGFWRGSWAEVRSEMRGRYPKHLWPEDPASAAPTKRAKPRGT